MYLLDRISKETEDKRQFARALLRNPMRCDTTTMRRWIDGDVCDAFFLVQCQCEQELKCCKPRPLSIQMGWLSLAVRGTTATGDEYVSDQLSVHAVNQLQGQIREDLWSRGECFDDLPVPARTALTLLYVLAELSFWLLFGLIRRGDDRFLLTDDKGILEACRLYFLGHQLAMESHTADALDQAYLLECARRDRKTIGSVLLDNPAILAAFTDWTLDKCFSCHPDYIHMMQSANKQQFDLLKRRSRLIYYLFLRSQEELSQSAAQHNSGLFAGIFRTTMTAESLVKNGFTKDDIDFLLLQSQGADVGGKLLQETPDGRIGVGNLSLKYALVAYSKDFFRSNAEFGDWFDKNYIKNYLKDRVPQSRYAILEGFRSRNEPVKYDVDVMIFDRKFRRLYFIQIKHRAATALPYLRDELDEFWGYEPFGKAVDQLKGVKENLQSRKLLDKIKNCFHGAGLPTKLVSPEYLRDNAGYLIVHSVENFDFAKKDGFAMYEWNTFRNLLKGEMIQHVDRISRPVRVDIGGPPLDEPRKVADALIAWLDSQSRPASQLSFTEKLKMKESLYYDIYSTRARHLLGHWKLSRPYVAVKFPLL